MRQLAKSIQLWLSGLFTSSSMAWYSRFGLLKPSGLPSGKTSPPNRWLVSRMNFGFVGPGGFVGSKLGLGIDHVFGLLTDGKQALPRMLLKVSLRLNTLGAATPLLSKHWGTLAGVKVVLSNAALLLKTC